MHTELASLRYRGLDTWSLPDILHALWDGQKNAVTACVAALKPLELAVHAAWEKLGSDEGRLVYTGAGSAGMVAALDALDLGPTFSWPEERTALLLANGLDLSNGLLAANEDSTSLGYDRARACKIKARDVVIGISASGSSAFTVGVLKEARRRGALTIAVTSNEGTALAEQAAHVIVTSTGAEVIAGSTRLGAGTAQKVVLNLFSTALMVRLGFVHDNLMVNVRPENEKLRRRCVAMVHNIAQVSEEQAEKALERFGTVKRSVLALAGVAEDRIDNLLLQCHDNLRQALARAAGDGKQ